MQFKFILMHFFKYIHRQKAKNSNIKASKKFNSFSDWMCMALQYKKMKNFSLLKNFSDASGLCHEKKEFFCSSYVINAHRKRTKKNAFFIIFNYFEWDFGKKFSFFNIKGGNFVIPKLLKFVNKKLATKLSSSFLTLKTDLKKFHTL